MILGQPKKWLADRRQARQESELLEEVLLTFHKRVGDFVKITEKPKVWEVIYQMRVKGDGVKETSALMRSDPTKVDVGWYWRPKEFKGLSITATVSTNKLLLINITRKFS